MKYRWRRKLSSALSYVILLSMMVNMVSPALLASAQDLHQTPPIEPTPEVITPEEPIVIPPVANTPATTFQEDFQDGDTSDWQITDGWSLGADSTGNVFLTTTLPNQVAVVAGQAWENVSVQAQIGIAPGNTAAVSTRVTETSSYSAVIDATGAAYLYRGAELVAGMTGTAPSNAQFAGGLVWHQVAMTADGNTISVTVNGLPRINFVETVLTETTPGQVVFSTGANNTGSVALDNVSVQDLGATQVIPTPTLPPIDEPPGEGVDEPLPITSTTPPIEVTEEAPIEIPPIEVVDPITDTDVTTPPGTDPVPPVPTDTVNAPESPVEEPVIIEPDVALPEVADAGTPEETEPIEPELDGDSEPAPLDEIAPTPVPYSINAATQTKFGAALLNVLQASANGDLETANRIADDYYMERDAENRFHVVIWAAEGETAESLAALVTANSGILTHAAEGDDHVQAYLPAVELLNIASTDAVLAVTLPERAVSTDSVADAPAAPNTQGAGSVVPHSLDILGVNAWHLAGATGANVNIAVIDTGFVAPGTGAAERSCLGSNAVENGAGDNSHGIEVVEILCDMAPASRVWMYKAANATELQDMINRAARLNNAASANGFPRADVIVVTMDTGITGTSFAGSVNAAVATNIPVIASAGNTGSNAALRFEFVGGQSQITVNTSAGSVISYAWQGTGNYPTQLRFADTVLDSHAINTNNSTHQYVVPASCGDYCVLTLNIQGEIPTEFRVQVAGGRGIGSLQPDATITPLASGSMTELASLDTVISVGAVCAWQAGNGSTISRYQVLPESSIGDPGQANTANIKPSVVAPSRVSTSITAAQPECEGGFGGTSASAAHVAGMAALLISNPNMNGVFNGSSGRPFAIRTYLQTRTIDLHVGNTPDGYDNVYGAGLVQLGNPTYSFNNLFISNPADAVAGTAYYVGTGRIPFSEPNGSVTSPFTHPALAIQRAIEDGVGNVVFLPGEFVTSFAIPNPNRAEPLTITSFDRVDTGSYFPSEIWANDMYEGVAGIVIDNSENVVIDSLEFTGSTPLYEAVLPAGESSPSLQVAKLIPFDVTDSTSISLISNTFNDFDGPATINRSQGVRITGNTFDNFQIPTTTNFINGQEQEVPLFQSSAMRILDSGETDQIAITANTFQNNFLPLGVGTTASTIQEPTVNVQRSQALISRNRFLNNAAESVISVNQWAVGAEEAGIPEAEDVVDLPAVIYSNLFDNNPVGSSLIQIYQAPRFRFVNNTVVNHTFSDNELGNIITLGHGATDRLNIVNHRWELHNNLFYNNVVASQLVANPSFTLGTDGCLPIGADVGDAQNGARNNWFAPSFDGGECSVSIGSSLTPENDNIYTESWPDGNGNPQPLIPPSSDPQQVNASAQARAGFENFHFFSVRDPFNPFRLRPTPDEVASPPPDPIMYNPGVDTGDNTAVNDITTLDSPVPVDLLGLPRIINRPPDADIIVDIGAYELGDPDPIAFLPPGGDYDFVVPEDTLIIVNLAERITGGFEPYRFEFTNLPTVYDQNPFNACGGQPFGFDEATYVFTYCPPPDFYNNGITTTVPATNINFSYRAFGLLDTEETGLGPSSIEILYDSVPETQPLRGTAPTVSFLLEQNDTAEYRLEPFAFFNEAGNLEFSDPDPSIFENSPDVDYDFTYSELSVDVTALQFNPRLFDASFPEDPTALTTDQIAQIDTLLNDALDSDNVFKVREPGGLQPTFEQDGAFEFTYQVTDSDGQVGTRRVRVRFVDRIGGSDPGDDPDDDDDDGDDEDDGDDGDTTDPGDDGSDDDDDEIPGTDPGPGPGGGGVDESVRHIGLHDDASLDWRYSDGWVPFYYEPAINETLHYVGGSGETAEFLFTGDGFNLHWLGYPGGASYNIEIDHDEDGTFTPYNQLGLSCSPGTPTTNNPVVEFITFGCAGLESVAPDALRRIRITSQGSANAFIILDAIEVRDTALLAGLYDIDDFSLSFTGAWQKFTGIAGAVNDSLTYNTGGGTIGFTADGETSDSVVIYYTAFSSAGDIEVRLNGNLVNTISTAGPGTALRQTAVVSGIGDQDSNVEITAVGAVAIEAVELVSARRGLDPGFYYLDDANVRGAGRWVSFADPTARTGVAYYNSSINAGGLLFSVDTTTVDRIVIHHSDADWGGIMQVCGLLCAEDVVLPNAGARYSVFETSDLGLVGTKATIALNVVEGFIALEGITLLGPDSALEPGYYDQLRDGYGIIYNDDPEQDVNGWFQQYTPGPRGGTSSIATGEASAEFNVAAGTTGLVIYYTTGPGLGNIQVCATETAETCAVIASNGAGRNNNRAVLSADDLGLTGNAPAFVTIRPETTSDAISLEGLQVVGAYENTALPTLPGGFVPATTSAVRYIDQWVNFPTPLAIADNLVYTTQPGAAVMFKFEGQALNIYRTQGAGSGGFEVCINLTNCTTFNGSNAQTINWSDKITVDAGSDGQHIVEIRSLLSFGQWWGLEGFEVANTAQPLTVGYYEENDGNLTYIGDWEPVQDFNADSNLIRTTSGTNALNFTVDATNGARVVVHHPNNISDGTGRVWGQMQVCVDGVCETVNQGTSTNRFSVFDVPAAAPGLIEVTPVSGVIGVEGIQVLEAGGPLQPGYYANDSFDLNPTGWLRYEDPSGIFFKDGSLLYALGQAQISFNVDADAASEIAVHHPIGFRNSQIQICGVPATNCQTINIATSTRNVTTFDVATLGLTGDSAPVSINWVSGFGGFNGVEIVGNTTGAGPGYYEDDSALFGLTTTEWVQLAGSSGFSGGSLSYSQTPNASITFEIGGGAIGEAEPVTGFVAFFSRFNGGAPVEICYTRQSNGLETCVTDTTNNGAALENLYGVSVYGLPSQTTDGTALEQYSVVIRNQGSAANFLIFDSVAVLGSPKTQLTLGPGGSDVLYDDDNPNILYSPGPLWTQDPFPGSGFFDDSLSYTFRAGATAQIAMRGNALTLYQFAFASGSDEVRFCQVLGNETNSGVDCSEFAVRSNVTNYPAAITLYGFGFGEHQIVIENRDNLGFVILDAIQVR